MRYGLINKLVEEVFEEQYQMVTKAVEITMEQTGLVRPYQLWSKEEDQIFTEKLKDNIVAVYFNMYGDGNASDSQIKTLRNLAVPVKELFMHGFDQKEEEEEDTWH